MRSFLTLLLLAFSVALAAAQQPDADSCETQLARTKIQLELLERQTSQDRAQTSADLYRWMQRAQQAEKRAGAAQAPPAPAPEAPKAEAGK